MTTRAKRDKKLNVRITSATFAAIESQRGADRSQADYITDLVARDGCKTKPIAALDPLIWRAIIQAEGNDGAARVAAVWAQMVGGEGDG